MTRSLLLCVTLLALAGCAGAPAGPPRQASEIKVFEYNETRSLSYRIVERIWVEHWTSAFSIPGYPTEREAVAALKARAAQIGADAVLSLACLDQKTFWKQQPSYICYGDAIKLQ